MTTTATSRLDYPALDGRPVTEGHARLCREHGHATYVIDGVDQGMCPRCGDVTSPAATVAVEVTAEDVTAADVFAAYGVGPHTMTKHHRGKYARAIAAARNAAARAAR